MQYKIVEAWQKQCNGKYEKIYRVKKLMWGICWVTCRGNFYGDVFVPSYKLGFYSLEDAQRYINKQLCAT